MRKYSTTRTAATFANQRDRASRYCPYRRLHRTGCYSYRRQLCMGSSAPTFAAAFIFQLDSKNLLPVIASAIVVWRFLRNPRRYRRLLLPVVVAGIVVMGVMLWEPFHLHIRNDFLQFYTGAKYVGSTNFYRESAEDAYRLSLEQRQHPTPYVRLPFYAVFLRPFASLPYDTAYVLWQILVISSFLITAFLWRQYQSVVLLACAVSLPVGMSLVRGQDLGFIVLLLSASVVLFYARKPLLSGAFLALCASKWNIVVTLPLLIVTSKDRRLCLGFFGAGLALLAASFAAAGPNWPSQYIELLRLPVISPERNSMPNLEAMLSAVPGSFWTTLVFAIVVLFFNWMIVRGRASFEQKMLATLITSILVCPHVYAYDCAILIPFLVATAYQTDRWLVRYVSVLLLSPALYAVVWSPTWYFLTPLTLLWLLVLLASGASEVQGPQDFALGAR